MFNQPFDTTIINPLERPKSSDINAAQSELHRDLRDYLLRAYAVSDGADVLTATAQTGFVGRGFVVEPTSPASMDVTIAQGIGFQATLDSTANVGSIAGLNDLSYYKPMLLSGSMLLTVPNQPLTGFCRRDLIEVRYNRALTNVTTSDVYNVVSGVFTSQNINKTMTFDLVNDAVQLILAGDPAAASASIVYRTGTLVPHATAADFLNAPIPSTDTDYVAIAVINVGPGATAINSGLIADWRPRLTPQAQIDITGSFTIGGADSYSSTTQQLSNVRIKAPAGIRCTVSKDTSNGFQNQYLLTILGPPTITDITAFFTPYAPLSVLSGGSYTTYGAPMLVATQLRTRNASLTAAGKSLLANASLTSPQILAAVGQTVHQIQFSVGYAYSDSTLGPDPVVIYATDPSRFNPIGSAVQTADVSFLVKVAV